jgi:Domain of unknown function (DUF5666)
VARPRTMNRVGMTFLLFAEQIRRARLGGNAPLEPRLVVTYEISPVPPTPQPSRGGHAARGAGIVAACLVAIVGTAVVLAAVSAPRSAAGAEPSASAVTRSAAPSAGSGERQPALRGDKGSRAGGAFGSITIASINGTKIGLETADGWTRTIDVAGDTKVFLGREAGKVSDLAVGDQVRLRQKRNADGTFSVVSLTVPAARAGGEVTAVSGNTITIKRRDGSTATLTVNGSTVFRQGGETAAKADVKVGSNVTAEGRPGSSDAFTATVIKISLSRVGGEVTAKSADTITVKQRDGSSVVVHVDAATRYLVRGTNGAKATLANVEVGNRLVAVGVRRADGSLDATAVGAGKARAPKAPKPAAPAPSATNG